MGMLEDRTSYGATSEGALARIWNRRELLYLLTVRTIRVRYKQSLMGIAWALLVPLVVVAAGLVIRMILSGGEPATREDLASVLVKSLPWALFVSCIRFGTNSLVGNSNLVSKMAFPKEVFPLSESCAAMFDFMVALLPALGLLVFLGFVPNIQWLWAPVLLIMLTSMAVGLALILSAANLFFRDVKYLVELGLNFAIFFTPVLFEAEALGRYANVVMLNPVAPILEGLRHAVVLGQAPELGWLAYSLAVAVLMLVVGYRYFKRSEYLFAEMI